MDVTSPVHVQIPVAITSQLHAAGKSCRAALEMFTPKVEDV